jgi:very-short-patch-repair endonuclease
MMLSDPASSLMATHTRLRANGFGIVSVVSARTPLDARVWLGQWCRGNDRLLTVAPVADSYAAMEAYRARLGRGMQLDGLSPGELPFLLLPGPFNESIPVAAALVEKSSKLPIAVACGLAEVVESLLDPEMPLRLVSTALEGLIPTEDAERQVLKTVAEGRRLQPFLRGACEGLVYYMLQARAETRGLFEANMRVDITNGSRRHEVDLLCAVAKIVIEIDGPEHEQPWRKAMDAKKQEEIESQGYRVRRFSNKLVIEDPVGVWRLIHEQLAGRIDAKENDR